MLIPDLYSVGSSWQEDGLSCYGLVLNPGCRVYTGHFPGEPVTPGVCSIEIMAECASASAGKELAVSRVADCRFLKIVSPGALPRPVVKLSLAPKDDGTWTLNASMGDGKEDYVTLKAELKG